MKYYKVVTKWHKLGFKSVMAQEPFRVSYEIGETTYAPTTFLGNPAPLFAFVDLEMALAMKNEYRHHRTILEGEGEETDLGGGRVSWTDRQSIESLWDAAAEGFNTGKWLAPEGTVLLKWFKPLEVIE